MKIIFTGLKAGHFFGGLNMVFQSEKPIHLENLIYLLICYIIA